ncbi:ABC transporter permease subunit [Acidisoma cellulosilytica]|uniref:ABC transporter permease subunit n=1 Tax=Acidisoma cellulosilyticum TaxID=2802395 RepID=A0A963Z5D2_9PROT|nr:ABC transporter permease subunit [Acidisoma cellulosilyticum]MCB8882147.1 ABC transporter permease subunit [Acidisoma cellulosilyticum]
MDIHFLLGLIPTLLSGLPLTLELTVFSLLGGGVIALLLNGLRAGSIVGARVADFYVFLFRGSPLLLQIFLIYYAPGQFSFIRHSFVWPFLREPYVCALLALMLNDAAYTSEIIRAGLRAAPRGAIEAAVVGGMSPLTRLRRVILPLAFRQALPAYGIEITGMLKSTSLASVVTLMDVTGIASAEVSQTYRAIEVFLTAAVIYLVLVTLVTYGVQRLEGWLSPTRTPLSARSAA